MDQVGKLADRRAEAKVVEESAMTRETEPVMGEALRLFVFLFSLLGSLMGGGGGRSRKKRGIPSMVAKRMMGYREAGEGEKREQAGRVVSSGRGMG